MTTRELVDVTGTLAMRQGPARDPRYLSVPAIRPETK
jgi:hypothetical protein